MSLNPYDASASMLGYIYQIRYALLAALRKFEEVEDPDLYFISIEKLDDISFDADGSPEELLQTKFHGVPANLTDKSPDIWKTLRIWAEYFKNSPSVYASTNFFLITTEVAQDNSLAYFLSIHESKRDIDKAIKKLKALLVDQPSEENKKGYLAINSLTQVELASLISKIFILDKTKGIKDLHIELTKMLRLQFDRSYLKASIERLEGAWFKLSIDNLNNDINKICLNEIQDIIEDIRKQMHPLNLPNDYSETPIDRLGKINYDHLFIRQVKLFTDNPDVINLAMENYYRSYYQIAKWSADGLLMPTEAKNYHNKVLTEWRNTYHLSEMDGPFVSEDDKRKFAKNVYKECQNERLVSIRERFVENFVCRGTYHYLSNEKKLWWHPEHLTLLKNDTKEDE